MDPIADIPFFTPVYYADRERVSAYDRVVELADGYLAPLSIFSSYSGHYANAQAPLDAHDVVLCDLEASEGTPWWGTALKVASYIVFPLPIAAMALKAYDRNSRSYGINTEQVDRAIATENVELLWQLHKQGEPLERMVHNGVHAFHLFAKYGKFEQLEYCLEHGFDADLPDVMGRTALHYACWEGQERAVELLLEHRAHPNLVDESHRTPLHYVAYQGHWDCLFALNEHPQLCLSVADRIGETPIDIAERVHENLDTEVRDMLSAITV